MTGSLPPILHRDDRLLVFDKPPGLLSVPGIGPERADCLATRAAAACRGARIVHRLDRDTSGVIILALDPEAHRQLSIQFQERLVAKRYVAVVAGNVVEDAGEIDLPMRKDLENPPRQIIDFQQGRPAQTRWRVLARVGDRTRLELSPRTGRSHQLRLHLKEVGHPILGDDLYAPPEIIAAADRLLLHAQSLTIIHPTSASLMTFEAPCPF